MLAKCENTTRASFFVARSFARNGDGRAADPERAALSESKVQVADERIVHTFDDFEGEKARESYRRYFDLKRAAEGKRPLVVVEIAGAWCALEPESLDEDNGNEHRTDTQEQRNDTNK